MEHAGDESGNLRLPSWITTTCRLLESSQPALWGRCSSRDWQTSLEEEIRLELLRSAVPLVRDEHRSLYGIADEAAARLRIDIPLTLYQDIAAEGPPISICAWIRSADLVMAGKVSETPDERLLRPWFGHELGHVCLWRQEDARPLTALRILEMTGTDPPASPVLQETLQRFRLLSELFCDRLAAIVSGDASAVIDALQLQKGLSSEADFPKKIDYPESEQLADQQRPLRIRALSLWNKTPDEWEKEIERWVCGELAFEKLDLAGQVHLARLTRQMLDQILEPSFMQTPWALAQARQYFDDYAVPGATDSPAPAPIASDFAKELARSYFAWVLLDFVPRDESLRGQGVAHLTAIAGRLGFGDSFDEIARGEFKSAAAKTPAAGDSGPKPRAATGAKTTRRAAGEERKDRRKP